jgi:hypothetical protein
VELHVDDGIDDAPSSSAATPSPAPMLTTKNLDATCHEMEDSSTMGRIDILAERQQA